MNIIANALDNSRLAVIIDPIFRGSRLHQSALAAMASVKNGIHPLVVTRFDFETDHYQEIFQGIPHSIIRVFRLRKNFWYGKMSWASTREAIHVIDACRRSRNCEYVHFTGWNEWFPLLNLCLLIIGKRVRGLRVVTIDYSPEYLIRDKIGLLKSAKAFGKRVLMMLLLVRIRSLRVLIQDERVTDPGWSRVPAIIKSQVMSVVDPAVARIVLPSRVVSRENIPVCSMSKRTLVTLIGRQSRRKGLSDLVGYLEKYHISNKSIRFVIVGQLDEDTEYLRDHLAMYLGGQVEWKDDYVAEEELYDYYERTDYVMLPYMRDFRGSSGVMANALMHRKPVIATDHGLLGYRTKTYRIGIAYESGNIDSLEAALRSLPRPYEALYEEMVARCEEISKRATPEVYMKELSAAALF